MKTLPKEVQTNVDFVSYIMDFSPYGGLTQAFVIEAIRYYSTFIVEHTAPEDKPNAYINPKIWYEIAQDVKESYEAKYGKPLFDRSV